MSNRLPLFTTAGVIVAALGTVAYVGGWRLGWVELMVVAGGCLVAVAVATPFVIGKIKLDVVRALEPDRVMVGEPARAVLDITNPGKVGIRRRVLEDSIDSVPFPIAVGPLSAGERMHAVYDLPTTQRGVVAIGPAVIARQDPLQLLRREVRQVDAQKFWVHPRYKPIAALPVGFAKDLEGPTSDTSPIGDVAFHALREYQPGDDYRHIHWMSTARTGTPLVRHYVDNRRPQLTVVLDNRRSALSGSQFEVAVEVVASLAVSSMLHQQPVAVWNSTEAMLGRAKPGSRNDILDRLTLVGLTDGGDLTAIAMRAAQVERGTSAMVLVTGGLPAVELMSLAIQLRRRARVVIVRVWPLGAMTPSVVPGARVIDVESLTQFQRGWRQVGR